MDDIRSLFFGVTGGVLGAFFKFWIQDFRDWKKNKLTKSEIQLLVHMRTENGLAHFVIKNGVAPCFENRIQDIDHPEYNFEFKDLGETVRLVRLGYIEVITPTDQNNAHYRLTGKGYEKVGESWSGGKIRR